MMRRLLDVVNQAVQVPQRIPLPAPPPASVIVQTFRHDPGPCIVTGMGSQHLMDAAHMRTPRPVSRCTLCRAFGGSVDVDYMSGETVPRTVFALKGLIDTGSGEVKARSPVWCPQCDTEYAFYEELEHMLYSVAIWPKSPRGGFPSDDKTRDVLLLKNLKIDLRSREKLYVRYAVRNLLPWAIERNDRQLILEMLEIASGLPIPDVLHGIKMMAPSLEPYHDQLVELSFHKWDTIHGHALECIQRTRPTDELARFADEILREMNRRGPTFRTWSFLEALHKRGISLDAGVPMLAATICAIVPGKGTFDEALIFAKYLARNDRHYAKALLAALEKAPRPVDGRSVGALKRMAKAALKQG